MKNLTTAIYGKLTSSTNLYTHISNRLYDTEAPEGAEFPYVVYQIISDVPEYPGRKIMERVLLQFSIWSILSSSTEAKDILEDLRTLYDDCTMTITSNTLIYFIRGNLTTMRDQITTPTGAAGAWNFIQEYELSTTN